MALLFGGGLYYCGGQSEARFLSNAVFTTQVKPQSPQSESLRFNNYSILRRRNHPRTVIRSLVAATQLEFTRACQTKVVA